MNFNEFASLWHHSTFLAAAFNDEQDFEAFLDDPECGVGNPSFDMYADEINEYIVPTKMPEFVEFVEWDEI